MIEKDEKVRAWAKIGSFAADLPRIVGTSYLLSPFLGPVSSGIVRITSPVLSRVATNPKAFKAASRFLVDLPTRMLSDTAVFAALSAPHPKEMIEGAKTGLIFGAFAGPAGYKLQPLMTGLAA